MSTERSWWGKLPWLWLAAVVLIVDQLTKVWAQQAFLLYERWDITSFFSFTLAYNTGAAFSFLSESGGWQRWFFSLIAVVVSVVLVGWIRKLEPDEGWLAVALSLILGGALGNLYDRVVLGHVVDFILVHYQNWYFPAFNIADSAITVGAIMLIIDMLRGNGKSRQHSKKNA